MLPSTNYFRREDDWYFKICDRFELEAEVPWEPLLSAGHYRDVLKAPKILLATALAEAAAKEECLG